MKITRAFSKFSTIIQHHLVMKNQKCWPKDKVKTIDQPFIPESNIKLMILNTKMAYNDRCRKAPSWLLTRDVETLFKRNLDWPQDAMVMLQHSNAFSFLIPA